MMLPIEIHAGVRGRHVRRAVRSRRVLPGFSERCLLYAAAGPRGVCVAGEYWGVQELHYLIKRGRTCLGAAVHARCGRPQCIELSHLAEMETGRVLVRLLRRSERLRLRRKNKV